MPSRGQRGDNLIDVHTHAVIGHNPMMIEDAHASNSQSLVFDFGIPRC